MDLEKVKEEIIAVADQYRARLANTSSTDKQDLIGFAPLMPLRMQEADALPDLSPGTQFKYKQLVAFQDRAFIRNAYIVTLGHAPDPQGERHYLQKFRDGMTRVEILARLRYSGEGRRNAVRLKGLLFPAILAFFYKIPLLGSMLRWQIELWQAPRNIRLLQNRMADMEDQQRLNNALLEDRINEALVAINCLQRDGRNS